MTSGISFVTSHSMSVVAFMLPHIRALKSTWPVQVLANSNERNLLAQFGVNLPIECVPIERPIAPLSDILALWVLYWKFKKSRPVVVHTITPKAGLLGMVSAWLARVPVRVHSFTGQVWVTRSGFIRFLLKSADRCIALMATDVLVDSPSQREFLIEQGILTAQQSRVLSSGSICGVNTERFKPNQHVREVVRQGLGTKSESVVCLYLGRLAQDKGVFDLANAFAQIAVNHPKAELWIVGPDEGNYFQKMQVILGEATNQVRRVDFTHKPECFMQAADLLCLPSYREGFGSSVIEAAACGVPALVSEIYGLTDAVVDGETGWMHKAGDVSELSKRLDYLLANGTELVLRGQAARKYVETYFAEEIVVEAMVQFYRHRLL